MKKIIVFTNGCFDLIHPGHVDFLNRAKKLGTKLIVGINSDRSVRIIKGSKRPILNENARKEVLLALKAVDEVLIFDEPTPEKLIKQIKPDILVKGGDWKKEEIIGADFVLSYGGKVVSLPLREGFSTSAIIEKVLSKEQRKKRVNCKSIVSSSIKQHLDVFESLSDYVEEIESCAKSISEAIDRGNKILICGNGGSAADAQHIAAELVGRYERERNPLPAIALTTDTSILTAISNDYTFKDVFARQVEALANNGDVLVAISTSGNSENVIQAVMKARQKGCITIALTGEKGKKLASLCDKAILVPSDRTSRIQEAHITIGHIWCELIEYELRRQV